MDRQPDDWHRMDQHIDQPVSIKLERGQKGGYGWEIKVYAETIEAAILDIKHADARLREEFIGGSNEKQTA